MEESQSVATVVSAEDRTEAGHASQQYNPRTSRRYFLKNRFRKVPRHLNRNKIAEHAKSELNFHKTRPFFWNRINNKKENDLFYKHYLQQESAVTSSEALVDNKPTEATEPTYGEGYFPHSFQFRENESNETKRIYKSFTSTEDLEESSATNNDEKLEYQRQDEKETSRRLIVLKSKHKRRYRNRPSLNTRSPPLKRPLILPTVAPEYINETTLPEKHSLHLANILLAHGGASRQNLDDNIRQSKTVRHSEVSSEADSLSDQGDLAGQTSEVSLAAASHRRLNSVNRNGIAPESLPDQQLAPSLHSHLNSEFLNNNPSSHDNRAFSSGKKNVYKNNDYHHGVQNHGSAAEALSSYMRSKYSPEFIDSLFEQTHHDSRSKSASYQHPHKLTKNGEWLSEDHSRLNLDTLLQLAMTHLQSTVPAQHDHISATYIPPHNGEHKHTAAVEAAAPAAAAHTRHTKTGSVSSFPGLTEPADDFLSSYSFLDTDPAVPARTATAGGGGGYGYSSALRWKHEAEDGVPLGMPPPRPPHTLTLPSLRPQAGHAESHQQQQQLFSYSTPGHSSAAAAAAPPAPAAAAAAPAAAFNNNSVLWNNVPGVPGDDYPVLTQVPVTDFSCNGKVHGLYADYQAQCQVWHNCHENGHDSFLCVAGTLFSPVSRTCDWWYNVDCTYTTYPPYQ